MSPGNAGAFPRPAGQEILNSPHGLRSDTRESCSSLFGSDCGVPDKSMPTTATNTAAPVATTPAGVATPSSATPSPNND